jgi:hypothetical protein
MKTHEYYSRTGYRILMGSSSFFCILFASASLYFYFIEKAPIWLGLIFIVLAVILMVGTINTIRYPSLSFDGANIIIRRWFGGVKKLDPFSPMEVAKITDGSYVIKQNGNGFALIPNSIGKVQFESLLKNVQSTGENFNKKVHLTLLS